MDRRGFLRGMTGLLATTALPVSATASIQKVPVLQCYIRGFRYHQGEELLMEMRLGCSLDLAREPENRYDRNAIMVIFEGRQIGYVPREHNLVLSKLMDTAVFDVCAEISLVRFHADPWEKVEMIIYVMNRNRG